MKNNLELRMYGLVPYNISDIQKGIQYGHSVVRYGRKVQKDFDKDENKFKPIYDEYIDWADNHETFIILNGGTTNKRKQNDGTYFGTLNNHLNELIKNDVYVSYFYEPDLGDQLTGVTFIVDERVFNKKDYPDFKDWLIRESIQDVDENSPYSVIYQKWVKEMGGKRNIFLREFLSNFRLA